MCVYGREPPGTAARLPLDTRRLSRVGNRAGALRPTLQASSQREQASLTTRSRGPQRPQRVPLTVQGTRGAGGLAVGLLGTLTVCVRGGVSVCAGKHAHV